MATSFVTMWLTLVRRGQVKMTRPSTIYFGPDGGIADDRKPKIYLRTLLFCTSKRGRIIETMHASLTRNESRQTFNIWVVGENKLSRGSGLFVGESGMVVNHHFLAPEDGNYFKFQEGVYRLDVFAKLLNDSTHRLLFTHELQVTAEHATAIASARMGLYFDWGPDSNRYVSHIRQDDDLRPDDVKALFKTMQTVLESDKKRALKTESSINLSDEKSVTSEPPNTHA